MPPTIITIREQLLGSVYHFLEPAGPKWTELVKVITELTVALPGYREEEVPLFPIVFLCDNIDSMIGSDQRLRIGKGEPTTTTALAALKRCAPLAQGGWSIFIEHLDSYLRFGVFRPSTLSSSLNPKDIFAIADLETTHVLAARPLSNNCVELLSDFGGSLQLHLSAGEPETLTTPAAIEVLARAVVRDVPDEWKTTIYDFLSRSLTSAVQRAHGSLVAVQNSKSLDKEYDGIWLDDPIDIAKAVIEVEQVLDKLGVSRLQGIDHLIQGMIRSDGITLFSSDGKILGFNLFVQIQNQQRPATGGARSRAFQTLSARIGLSLCAAVKISQDGKIDIKG
jgi:hypothetical protein